MVRILLIRPGSTDYDAQGRIQGTLDIPLNDEGRAQVERLGQELAGEKVSAIYTSCSQAARETAETLAHALGVKAKRLDNMQNLDQGLWQGMLVEDVKRKHPKVYRQGQEQPECICPPEGEVVGHAQQRVVAALSKLLKKHDGQETVALVLPEPLISLARAHLTHEHIGGLWAGSSACGGWQAISLEPAASAVQAVVGAADRKPSTAGSWFGMSVKAS